MGWKSPTAPAAVTGKPTDEYHWIFPGRCQEAFESEVRRPASNVASAHGRDVPMGMDRIPMTTLKMERAYARILESFMKRLLLCGSLLLSPSITWAQSHTLGAIDTDTGNANEIIAVGQRIGSSSLEDVASPVSILSREDIESRNAAHVSDLLRSLPGLSVNRSGPGGALTQLRVRGSEANHILVLVDGVEVANPTAGEFDFAGLRAADIRRIEVLRGEQSALYGSDAIGGVLNIITSAGATETGMRFDVEAGSFNTLDGFAGGVIPIGDARLSISGGGRTTDGYDISGLDGEKDGAKNHNLNIGLNDVKFGGIAWSAKFGSSYLKSEFDEDTDFDGRLDNVLSETEVDRNVGRVDAKFSLGGFQTLVTASGQKTTTDTQGGFSSRSEGRRFNLSAVSKYEFGAGALTVLGEWEEERYEISPNFAFSPTAPKNETAALAADYTWSGNQLTLNGSVRHDLNDRFDDATTWRAGAVYRLDNVNGLIRGSVGTGVKNPSLIELFGFFPESNFVGNPDLQPETSTGYNIGYDQYLAGRNVKLSVNYFRSDLEDEIFTDFSSFPFLARNRTTDSKREGVEIEGRWQINSDLNIQGSATFLNAKENGVEEIRRPDFLASATANWQATDDLNFTLSVDHTGSQQDTDFAIFTPVTLEAFTLVGLNAAYDVTDVWGITLRGENLLDEDYQEVVGYASQGRGIYGGLRARF